ncbi:MAG: metallophosphoesterase [Propionibacteriaceae bacterium]|nr:metallophosphoesterase [Propionibacteriaceae bacterium]
MPRASQAVKRVGQTAAGAGALAFGCLAYAGSYEVNAFRLRRVEIPVLPAGSAQLRVLHISDLHLTPGQRVRQQWVARLAALEPDLVIDTGDNIARVDAVPFLTRCLGRLLDVPGVYVWGSNDYFGPTLKNPLRYLTHPDRQGSVHTEELPWRDLGRAFTDAGWIDLNDRRATVVINGIRIAFRGTDDAHLNRDNYGAVAGPIDRNETDVAIGVTHAPYRRVLDPMTSDGHDLIVAGHTHGGQICVPFYGALVTNCDLDPARAKGLSSYGVDGRTAALHVSAGLGTSPYAPVRFACPPEATLMTLVPRRPT